jgi:CheY-like chemotaxis protein
MSVAVLVVDDESGMRETLLDIFEGAGYTVTTAADGAAALTLASEQRFDVIVMDIRMPMLTGVEVLASLDHPPPQVILMTAYALEEQLRGAREHRAYAIVEKPFHVAHLLRLVADAVSELAS